MRITPVIVCSVVVLLFLSCSKSEPRPSPFARCDWPKDRKVIEVITKQAGVVLKAHEQDFYQIKIEGRIFLYNPCNLPLVAQKDSLSIVVTGNAAHTDSFFVALEKGVFFEITGLDIKAE